MAAAVSKLRFRLRLRLHGEIHNMPFPTAGLVIAKEPSLCNQITHKPFISKILIRFSATKNFEEKTFPNHPSTPRKTTNYTIFDCKRTVPLQSLIFWDCHNRPSEAHHSAPAFSKLRFRLRLRLHGVVHNTPSPMAIWRRRRQRRRGRKRQRGGEWRGDGLGAVILCRALLGLWLVLRRD